MATQGRARTGAGATTRTCTPTRAAATTRARPPTRAAATTRTCARTRAAYPTDVVAACRLSAFDVVDAHGRTWPGTGPFAEPSDVAPLRVKARSALRAARKARP